MGKIGETQYAVQLTGADELCINSKKEVPRPGPFGIIAKVEAVGLCFSDLKLLKQFDRHARKREIISGISKEIFSEIQSYKPDKQPTVPGHEACCVIVAVGNKVKNHFVGQRVLVETDYRWLQTCGSNATFGYNFEGALQQYVLLDERIITEPQTKESFLIEVKADISASAVALVEPWACVESSYRTPERNRIKPDGKMLVAADKRYEILGLKDSFAKEGEPALIYAFCEETQYNEIKKLGLEIKKIDSFNGIPDETFDDIVYFGSQGKIIEILDNKLAAGGIINIVPAGNKISGDVSIGIGRIHYSNTRWIGTIGRNAAESYKNIPPNGEIRDGEIINIIGAAGPMGQMHTIRTVSLGKKNISVTACDTDSGRLDVLEEKLKMYKQKKAVELKIVNPEKNAEMGPFSYFVIMAPSAALAADCVKKAKTGAFINIFAGIPVDVKEKIDLNSYIEKKIFMFGTSGSRLEDMKAVLDKAERGQLDTNLSVEAVCGMAGAIEAIRAVEKRTITGKIIVYPQLIEIPLIHLRDLRRYFPAAADKLNGNLWTKEAEKELLKAAV